MCSSGSSAPTTFTWRSPSSMWPTPAPRRGGTPRPRISTERSLRSWRRGLDRITRSSKRSSQSAPMPGASSSSPAGRRAEREIDDERSAVDRSGAARRPLSVCRWRETGPPARPNGGAGGAAGLVLEVPRRGRGARRARPGPPRASADPVGPHLAGRGGAGDHHDRSDGRHVGGRYGRGGADERGRGAACCVRRLRPLAAGAVSRLVPPVGAPARRLSTKQASRKEQTIGYREDSPRRGSVAGTTSWASSEAGRPMKGSGPLKTKFNLPGLKKLLLPRPTDTASLDTSVPARALFEPPPETAVAEKRRSLVDFLKQVTLFEDLSRWDLRRLARIVHERDYRDGEYVFEEGKPGAALFVLRRGMVEVVRRGSSGTEVPLAILEPPACFEESAAMGTEAGRWFSARARGPGAVPAF